MKIAKQLILPVILILIFSVYLGVKKTGEINYKIPSFTAIDSSSFRLIEITNGSETLKLYADEDSWKFSTDDRRINQGRIKEILNFFSNPNFIDMVSDSGTYQNFGLDKGKYITIKAYIDSEKTDKPDRVFYIGNLSNNRNFTYIMNPEDSNVFTVSNNIRSIFDTTKDELMDKRIISFDTTKIDKVSYYHNNGKIDFIKSVGENDNDNWESSDGTAIDSRKLEQSIRYLSNSLFESFSALEPAEDKEILLKLDLSGDDISENFSIIKKIDNGYLVKSSFNEGYIVISDNTGSQLLKMFTEIAEAE